MSVEYWIESVESSFGEHGIAATTEQVKAIAADMEGSHETYDMAYGYDVASQNLEDEKTRTIESLRKALADEQAKVHCEACRGRGYTVENFGAHSSTSRCSRCKGNGRHAP